MRVRRYRSSRSAAAVAVAALSLVVPSAALAAPNPPTGPVDPDDKPSAWVLAANTVHPGGGPTGPASSSAAKSAGTESAGGNAMITVDGTCTLADAIIAANTDAASGACPAGDPGLDTIDLTVDVVETQQYSSAAADGGVAFPTITTPIELEGNGHTVEVDSIFDARVFVVGPSGDLTVSDATLTGGRSTQFALFTAKGFGGGILNRGALTLDDVVLVENEARRSGGALYNVGTVTVADSVLVDNEATETHGGAIGNHETASMTIDSSELADNAASANGAMGGAIMNYGDLTVTATSFSGNDAKDGAAIFTTGDTSAIGTLAIDDSTFVANGPSADGDGGAVVAFKVNPAVVDVTRSTFEANQAGNGGALWAFQSGLDVSNSTFVGNLAHGTTGAAIYAANTTDLNVDHVTAVGNETLTGGATEAWLGGNAAAPTPLSVDVTASLISGECDNNIDVVDPGTNLATDPTCADTSPVVTVTALAVGAIGSNGGATDTVLPSPTSPAVDAISCPTGTDQRGGTRPVDLPGIDHGGTCDIGAVELADATHHLAMGNWDDDYDTTSVNSLNSWPNFAVQWKAYRSGETFVPPAPAQGPDIVCAGNPHHVPNALEADAAVFPNGDPSGSWGCDVIDDIPDNYVYYAASYAFWRWGTPTFFEVDAGGADTVAIQRLGWTVTDAAGSATTLWEACQWDVLPGMTPDAAAQTCDETTHLFVLEDVTYSTWSAAGFGQQQATGLAYNTSTGADNEMVYDPPEGDQQLPIEDVAPHLPADHPVNVDGEACDGPAATERAPSDRDRAETERDGSGDARAVDAEVASPAQRCAPGKIPPGGVVGFVYGG